MQPDFAQDYAVLLQEYDSLLREMMESRQSMLLAVTAGKLDAVLKAMHAAQADTMRLEKLDARRLDAQAQQGLAPHSIPEMVAQFAPAQQALLQPLAGSIAHQVEALRFLSEKSIGMAQCNLAEMNPRFLEETLQQSDEGTPENPYQKQRRADGQRPSMETKA